MDQQTFMVFKCNSSLLFAPNPSLEASHELRMRV